MSSSPGGDVPSLLDRWPGGPLRFRSRSIRYHRPRSLFCGVGLCSQCLVRVDGQPNVRACRHLPAPGEEIRCPRGFPSARWDLGRLWDLVLPHGVDAVRGFRRPRALQPLYRAVVRRMGGYDRPPSAPAPAFPAAEAHRVQIAVVGSGTAGRAAAEALVEAGRSVAILEARGDRPAVAGARLLFRTDAMFLARAPDGRWRVYGERSRAPPVVVDAEEVVLATGSYAASLLVRNGDRPGVVTADAVLRRPREAPALGSRTLVFGGGALAAEVLLHLGRRAVALAAPGHVAPGATEAANEVGARIYPRVRLRRILGFGRVRGVEMVDREDRSVTTIRADTVVFAHRRLPNASLAFLAGAEREFRPLPGAWFPRSPDGVGTTVPGLYVAGSVVRREPSAESGRRAPARLLGKGPGPAPPPLADDDPDGFGDPQPYFAEWLGDRSGGGKAVLCPCEDVLLEELLDAVERGYRGTEVIKRLTGIGTGLCQGRYCLPDVVPLLATLEDRPPAEVGTITARPPVVPAALAAWAAVPEEGA